MSSRRRALFSILIALVAIAVGLFAQRGAVLVLALPPLAYAAALIVSEARLRTPNLRIDRALSSNRIHENEEVQITLSVSQDEASEVFVSLRDDIDPGTTVVDGEHRIAGCLRPGETASTEYTLAAPRGTYGQQRVTGAIWSNLGLAVRDIDLRMETQIAALPEPESLSDVEIRPRRSHAFAGVIRTQRAGAGLEILGCREYALGDDIRKINWRASARREELIVNLFEQEKMTEVNVIVDARAQMHVDLGDVRTFDIVLRGAAGVASHFLQLGNRVGLLIYGDTMNWTYPAMGRLQMERILHTLARARPSAREAFGKLRALPSQLFSAGSQVILFSALDSSEDAEVPRQLVARGYSVILVHPDSVGLEFDHARHDAYAETAARILRLQSQALLSHLARAGVVVVNWDLSEPLAVAFHDAQTHMRGGRR